MARQKTSGTRKRLGRGLESLISSPVRIDVTPGTEAGPVPEPEPDPAAPKIDRRRKSVESAGEVDHDVRMLSMESIEPDPRQPRRDFDEHALEGLAQSIRSAGLMQPIVVRPRPAGGFQIVAGERRWRAARMVGLARVPAVVREVDDRTAAQWSLVENLQREDLNPIDRAEAFQRLADDFDLSHLEIADQVGLDRSSVTNHLRLTELDDFTKEAVRRGALSMGHGRALLVITNLKDRERVARQALARDWSVREIERRVRARTDTTPGPQSRPRQAHRAHMADLERRLGEHLGTRVQVKSGRRKGTGSLTISFYNLDQFEGLMQRLGFRYE